MKYYCQQSTWVSKWDSLVAMENLGQSQRTVYSPWKVFVSSSTKAHTGPVIEVEMLLLIAVSDHLSHRHTVWDDVVLQILCQKNMSITQYTLTHLQQLTTRGEKCLLFFKDIELQSLQEPLSKSSKNEFNDMINKAWTFSASFPVVSLCERSQKEKSVVRGVTKCFPDCKCSVRNHILTRWRLMAWLSARGRVAATDWDSRASIISGFTAVWKHLWSTNRTLISPGGRHCLYRNSGWYVLIAADSEKNAAEMLRRAIKSRCSEPPRPFEEWRALK